MAHAAPDAGSLFHVTSHVVSVPAYREYPCAILSEEEGVKIEVKQYVPRQATIGSSEAITIIAAGGLGFIKELYEPIFAELQARAQQNGLAIRAIWMADMFNTGASAVINRENLGCDPAWMDHARDLWSIMQHFRTEMARPIVGLGHSMGCNQLVCLSSWHPRLFDSLAFIEPGIDPEYGKGITTAWMLQTLNRPESWKTRDEAEIGLVKVHQAQAWDPRVVEALKRYGVYQVERDGRVKWVPTTPRDQVVALVSRLNAGKLGLGPGGIDAMSLEDRMAAPDVDPAAWNEGGFYRHELKLAWELLPHIWPWVLYINGGNSPFFGRPRTRDQRASLTGAGVGGNGGMKLGAVEQVVIEQGTHTMVFDDNVTLIADHIASWLKKTCERRSEITKESMATWAAKSQAEKQRVSPEFVSALKTQMKERKKARL